MSKITLVLFASAAVAGMVVRWGDFVPARIDTVRHITLEFRP